MNPSFICVLNNFMTYGIVDVVFRGLGNSTQLSLDLVPVEIENGKLGGVVPPILKLFSMKER